MIRLNIYAYFISKPCSTKYAQVQITDGHTVEDFLKT